MITSFIHEVRRSCPQSVVLFWSLDPDFVPRETLAAFDFDGIMTNSNELMSYLEARLPTQYLPLAADPNKFKPAPQSTDGNQKRDVVFVGSAGAIIAGSKIHLEPMLQSTISAIKRINDELNEDVSLVIYGKAWEKIPAFEEYYAGVLPEDSLADVYANALAVLGVTMDGQREVRMS